jgi:hypothetical protein
MQGANILAVAASTFSGSQGFLALIAGVTLAFTFQFLLTTFFIALGISYSHAEPPPSSTDEKPDNLDSTINHVGMIVGLRTLGTVSITLFAACFLAVKLSQTNDALLGAILSLVVWAAYFFFLIWVSSTTVSSVIGSILTTATSGLQGIVGTAAIAIGAKTASDQVVATAEAAATAIRHELGSAADVRSSRQAIDNYLKNIQLPEAERQEIQTEFEKLVTEPKMQATVKDNHLRNIGRQTFVDLVSSGTQFSKQDVNRVVNQLESFWDQAWGQQQPQLLGNGFLNSAMSTQAEEQESVKLSAELDQLIEETRKRHAQQQREAAEKVAETAAWWLFSTAFASAATSAIAGVIAVVGGIAQ